jgi:hypothetical protein
MICIRRKKCEKIINSLIQEYHSRYRQEANQRIAEVAQDHISRGFANSTVVVTKKLAVEYNYIDKLVDFLFQSLEKDFPKFPLKACKEILIRAAEVEYKKLPTKVNSWLMQACMAQQEIIKQYEDGILKGLEATKKKIENRCALSTEKRVQKKWWKDPKWIIGTVIAVIMLILALLGVFGKCRQQDVPKREDQTLRELMLREDLKCAEKFAKQYDLGYAIFGVRPDGIILRPGENLLKNYWDVEWATARVDIDGDKVTLTVPDIRSRDGKYTVSGNTVTFERGRLVFVGLLRTPRLKVQVGSLAETPAGLVCFIGASSGG